ncbi:MAG: type I methionyl aminopeptidase [Candidatus Omnitrophica bacterium]|nr:type I methionyl aminopeptidase [Candidatus Omnitrophota bacterium]
MIEVRSPEEIEEIRQAGRITHDVLIALSKKATPGTTTLALDAMAEGMIRKCKGRPAFKGYRGYPRTICTAVNDSVVHEIPVKSRVLREGDIVSFDVGVEYNGYYADAAVTVGIGAISALAAKLIDVTRDSLMAGIAQACAGNRVFDISHAVQSYVESYGFSVVRYFVGHGIGRALHEEPEIPNYGKPHQGARLQRGMILAIEPMVNAGSAGIKIMSDGWRAVTEDGSLSAHYEHTVVVTDKEPEIVT